jgi:hypothetical protein
LSILSSWKRFIKPIGLIGIGIGSTLGVLSSQQTDALTTVTSAIDQSIDAVKPNQDFKPDPRVLAANKVVNDALAVVTGVSVSRSQCDDEIATALKQKDR